MAKLVYRMNVSLDGYVDHDRMRSGPSLFRHWIEQVRAAAGGLYGRGVYETMRYWDEDRPEWGPDHHAFATAWRSHPKWVVSRSLDSAGPLATLVSSGLETAVRDLKGRLAGTIAVSGPGLAGSLTELGLVDEYQLYLNPVVLGRGTPFFAAARPPLRLVASDLVGDGVIRLRYVPED